VSIAIFLDLLVSPASAQVENVPLRVEGAPRFYIDAVCFRASDPAHSYVELFYQIANDELQFVRTEAGFEAKFEMELIILDAKGNVVKSLTDFETVFVRQFDRTNSQYSHRINQFAVILPPGEYTFRAILRDLSSRQEGVREKVLRVPAFDSKGLLISELQLAREIALSQESSKFVKNGRRVVPNVTRTFGTSGLELFVYYEVYNLQPSSKGSAADSFRVDYLIRGENGKIQQTYTRYYLKPGITSVQTVRFSLEDFPAGRYQLEVRVCDQGTGEEASSRTQFFVNWPYSWLVDRDFERVLRQLRYIAKTWEIEKLRKTPPEKRLEAFQAFWKSRDPTPQTPENELMMEYYRRIRYANEHFRTQLGEGWESDQGQVYIIFGPPDEIRRYPFELATKPYEVWEYYSLNLSFVFVDEDGVGEYRLLDPFEANRFLSQ